MGLQKVTACFMDVTSKQRGRLKGNDNRKIAYIQKQKEITGMPWTP